MNPDFASPTRMFFRLRAWVFLGPLLIAVLFGWLSWSEGHRARMMDAMPREVEGLIVSKHEVNHSSGSTSVMTTTSYSVVYAYEVAGIAREAQQGVTEAFYYKLDTGAPVTVTYAGADPSISEVERGGTQKVSIWTKIVAVLFLLAALGLGRWQVGVWRSALRAARRGQARQAAVTEHVPGVSVGKTTYYRLGWTNAAGKTQRSCGRRETELSEWPVESEIAVYPDPDGKREWFVGDLT